MVCKHCGVELVYVPDDANPWRHYEPHRGPHRRFMMILCQNVDGHSGRFPNGEFAEPGAVVDFLKTLKKHVSGV